MRKIIFFTTLLPSSGIENGSTLRTRALLEAIFPLKPICLTPKNFKIKLLKKADYIIGDHLQSAPFLAFSEGIKILNLHNLESQLFYSISEAFKNEGEKNLSYLYLLYGKFLEEMEKKYLKRFDLVIFPTEAEKEMALEKYKVKNSAVVENPSPPLKNFSPQLHTRNFSTLTHPQWFPNKISYFKIKKLASRIEGNWIPPRYEHLLSERIKNISLLLSLGLFSGGSKIKFLTGLAAGIPQVVTPFDIQNLNLKEGDGFLIGNTTKEWIEKANAILKNNKLKKSLSHKARLTFEKLNISFFSIKEKFQQIITCLQPIRYLK